jgi:hypothetical protein
MKHLLTIVVLGSLILEACNNSPKQKASIVKQPIKVDTMTYPVKHISVSINKSVEEVYQFTSKPENFPKWIAFIKSMSNHGQFWIGKTDIGDLKIKFAPLNDFGILDHHVTLANGVTIINPMRVVPNNKGCEFTFILFWMPDKTEKEFNEDAAAVTKDLQKLKELLES